MSSSEWVNAARVDGVEIWTWRDVLVLWQRGTYTLAAASVEIPLDALVARFPAGYRSVLLVEPSALPPEDAVRKRLAKAPTPMQRAFAVVTLESGFRAALVGSVVAGLRMISPAFARTPTRTFSTLADASAWLGPLVTPDDHAALAAALTDLREGRVR